MACFVCRTSMMAINSNGTVTINAQYQFSFCIKATFKIIAFIMISSRILIPLTEIFFSLFGIIVFFSDLEEEAAHSSQQLKTMKQQPPIMGILLILPNLF